MLPLLVLLSLRSLLRRSNDLAALKIFLQQNIVGLFLVLDTRSLFGVWFFRLWSTVCTISSSGALFVLHTGRPSSNRLLGTCIIDRNPWHRWPTPLSDYTRCMCAMHARCVAKCDSTRLWIRASVRPKVHTENIGSHSQYFCQKKRVLQRYHRYSVVFYTVQWKLCATIFCDVAAGMIFSS